jgi:hypothetical protein
MTRDVFSLNKTLCHPLVSDRTVNLTTGSPYIRHFISPFNCDEDPGIGMVTGFSILS